MAAKILMVQGVSSNAGKSIVTAALCRYFRDTGHRVAPFKPVLVLEDVVESNGIRTDTRFLFGVRAAGEEMRTIFNPMQIVPLRRDFFKRILSPASLELDGEAFEIPLLGADTPSYPDLDAGLAQRIRSLVHDCLERLAHEYDVVVVEGAGSPTDLGENDIGNFSIPDSFPVSTILVAKVSAGGSGASLLGTMQLLPEKTRRSVTGFIMNDMIGAEHVVAEVIPGLEERTGIPCLGILPNSWSVVQWSNPEEEIQILASLVKDRLRTDLL